MFCCRFPVFLAPMASLCCSPLSSLNCNFETRGENFVGSSIAEAFSRTVVEKLLDFGKTMLGDADQIRAFGKELPDQAVGVFVRATLPRAVRLRKVDLQSGFLRQPLVLGELLTVVQRQRLSQLRRRGLIQLGGGLTNHRRLQGGNLAQQQK